MTNSTKERVAVGSSDVVRLHVVIKQAIGNCGEDVPHVFESNRLPPSDTRRCCCGKKTWKQAVADAEAVALKAHTANAASVPPNALELSHTERKI